MNKNKRFIYSTTIGFLSLLFFAALIALHSFTSNSLLLVSCMDPAAAKLIGKLDCVEAVYRFHEEKDAVLYTPWRSTTTPVTWVYGDFAACNGEMLCGRWPENEEMGAVLLSERQAATLFGSIDCLDYVVYAGNVEGKIVGVYRPQQDLPSILAQPEGAPAYVMIAADEPDSLLAVQLVRGYDALLAVSEVKQQLMNNGVYGIEIEDLVLTAAQIKGRIQIMLAIILALYLTAILCMLQEKREKSWEQVHVAFQVDYFPASLRNAIPPFCRWLFTWLLSAIGLCACIWLFLDGIVVNPQFLPRAMTGSAIWNAIKEALSNLNSYRLPNAICCNILMWTQRLAKLCFVTILLLYLPWRKEASCHAQK